MSPNRDYHHPYKPYDIQIEFMNALYECIEDKQIGIFESPTGTGKSLSLLCGSLTWLRNHQILALEESLKEVETDGEPEWVVQHARVERKEAFLRTKRDLEARLGKIRVKEKQQRQRYESGESLPKRLRINENEPRPSSVDEDKDFLLDDYESDGETKDHAVSGERSESGLSSSNLDLAIKLGLTSKPEADEDLEAQDVTKVFYCSRTHSQLAQIAHEVGRLKIPIEIEETSEESDAATGNLDDGAIRHLSLGSRKNLCINKDVQKLNSTAAINERCLELQQNKKSDGKKCQFLPTKDNETLVHQFRDYALAKVRDIEDLGSLGKKIGICPYYATRATIKPSEIVTLPYPLMLQKSAREALDISLKNHVVIIDEAHNLMDTISGIYSVDISLRQLTKARTQIGVYLQKFRNKLKGKNRVYVTQMVRLIDSLISYLRNIYEKPGDVEGTVKVTDLTIGKGADQINLYKLSQYLHESKLARKVDGYALHLEETQQTREKTAPVLTQVQGFFQALTYPTAEGRFFYSKDEAGDVVLKYLLLDTTNHFREIVEEARAVILAGGTMSPMEDYKLHLFPYLDPSRLRTLSCGHVIPDSNLLAWPLAKSPTGIELDFTFEKRSYPSTIAALGQSLIYLAKVIPDGLVIFFPSYAYLDQLTAAWKKTSTASSPSIWDQLSVTKPIFQEAKGTSSVDDVLASYSNAILDRNPNSNGRGALLLSVVGGKMSEGINFSDALGRGVIIVGLPFPNAQSVEWKAKLQYVEQQALAQGNCSTANAKAATRAFYGNACMRAVNQSIGRAIRHAGDYAAILMLDRRYGTLRIQEKLPGWIKRGMVTDGAGRAFEEAVVDVRRFFEGKNGVA